MTHEHEPDADKGRSRRNRTSISFPGSRRRQLVIGLVLVTLVLAGLVFWVIEVTGTTAGIG